MKDVCDFFIMTNCHLMKNSWKKMGLSLFIVETFRDLPYRCFRYNIASLKELVLIFLQKQHSSTISDKIQILVYPFLTKLSLSRKHILFRSHNLRNRCCKNKRDQFFQQFSSQSFFCQSFSKSPSEDDSLSLWKSCRYLSC